jgi:hypothetical protein
MTDKPSGQPVGGAWAQQQKDGMKKQEQAKKESTAPSADPNKSRGELTEGRPEPEPNQSATGRQAQRRELSSAATGDERTPDKTIGEVKYAGSPDRRQGGAGEPEASSLEPEKQGGIGGP